MPLHVQLVLLMCFCRRLSLPSLLNITCPSLANFILVALWFNPCDCLRQHFKRLVKRFICNLVAYLSSERVYTIPIGTYFGYLILIHRLFCAILAKVWSDSLELTFIVRLWNPCISKAARLSNRSGILHGSWMTTVRQLQPMLLGQVVSWWHFSSFYIV